MLNIENIQKIMAEKKITVADLARGAGVSATAIYKLLKEGGCTVSTLIKLSKLLQVDINDLIITDQSFQHYIFNNRQMESSEEFLRNVIREQLEIIKELSTKLQETNKLDKNKNSSYEIVQFLD